MQQQSSLKVLVIEDDVVFADEVADSLRDEACDVVVASNAALGLALASSHAPHVVLLDLNLPDGHGFDVARSLRTGRLRTDVAIVVLTGSRIDDLSAADNVGVDLILNKPVEAPLLAGLLRHVREHRIAKQARA